MGDPAMKGVKRTPKVVEKKPTEKKLPKIHVPAREKLSELSHAQLVALRDSLKGQPKSVADKSYRRAVRKLERATRGKKVAPKKAAAKKSSREEAPQAMKKAA